MARPKGSQRGQRARRASRAAGIAGLAGATALTAHVASAVFQGTGTAVQSSASKVGDLSITLGNADASQTAFLSISDLSPGVTRYRALDITFASDNVQMKTLKFDQTHVTGSTALEGVILFTVDRCSNAWTASGSNPDRTYSCDGGGTVTHSVTSTALIGTKDLSEACPTNCTAGTTLHYVLGYTLPSNAADALQGTSDTISMSFYGTTRDAKNI